ncbi:MAG: leucyl/phenylalanyl-tRNA--protein transferase [Bacteroidetes bacterium]|nr:leucyl/phenylalanyl-tRNA--protein transferase [Bacteroidota bacterium]
MNDQLDLFPFEIEESTGNLVALGGDLHPNRLLAAYRKGAFPWYSEHEPIQWWSPNPRFVLFPSKLQVSHSMKPLLNQRRFRVTVDTHFEAVMTECARIKRNGQLGAWITADMLEAYVGLHGRGYAHSVEVWDGETMAGGLYGLAIGHIFFGESMFSRVSNASKYGLITLVRWLEAHGFDLIDCQQETAHLGSLGAQAMPRTQFLKILQHGILQDQVPRLWTHEFEEWLTP